MLTLPTFKMCLSRVTIGLMGVLAAVPAASAGEWAPARPIKLIVPSTPGAGADITARLFGERLAIALGQPVVVENRGGAGGLVGADVGAKSPPDGHTLVFGSDYAFTIYPQLAKTPYDPVKDFAPISLVVNVPMVLVVNKQKVEARNVAELIASAKANPGKFSIASAGNGSSHHLAAEYFKHQAGVNLLHVPYKGAAPAIADVLAGQADMMFVSPVTALPYLKSGKLRALAVSVPQRIPVIADVPTMEEAGVPDFDVGIWMGFLYPARTPGAAIQRVNVELQKILKMPEIRRRLGEMGYSAAGGTPEVLEKRIERDSAIYNKLIHEAHINLD